MVTAGEADCLTGVLGSVGVVSDWFVSRSGVDNKTSPPFCDIRGGEGSGVSWGRRKLSRFRRLPGGVIWGGGD